MFTIGVNLKNLPIILIVCMHNMILKTFVCFALTTGFESQSEFSNALILISLSISCEKNKKPDMTGHIVFGTLQNGF